MDTVGMEALLAGMITTLMAPLNSKLSGYTWWETVVAYLSPALGVVGAMFMPHLAAEPVFIRVLRGCMIGATAMGGHAFYKKLRNAPAE